MFSTKGPNDIRTDMDYCLCTFHKYFLHSHFVFFFTLLYCIDIHRISLCINITWCYIVFFYCNVNANVLRREHEICSRCSYKYTSDCFYWLSVFY